MAGQADPIDRGRETLLRLLREGNVRFVVLPPDYFTASVLAQAVVWNLRTAHGKLDLTLAPSGFPEGYTQLIADAEQRRVAATTITVAEQRRSTHHETTRRARTSRPRVVDRLNRTGERLGGNFHQFRSDSGDSRGKAVPKGADLQACPANRTSIAHRLRVLSLC
jgi:hypothetical protein